MLCKLHIASSLHCSRKKNHSQNVQDGRQCDSCFTVLCLWFQFPLSEVLFNLTKLHGPVTVRHQDAFTVKKSV